MLIYDLYNMEQVVNKTKVLGICMINLRPQLRTISNLDTL